DIVAVIDMRGIGRLVLAAKAVGDDSGEPADDEIGRVDQDPLLVHLRRLLRKGLHVDPSCDPCIAGTFLVACVCPASLRGANGAVMPRPAAYRRVTGLRQMASAPDRRFKANEINALGRW